MHRSESENIAQRWLDIGEEVQTLFSAGQINNACTLLEQRSSEINSTLDKKDGITFDQTLVSNTLREALRTQTLVIQQLLEDQNASHRIKVQQLDKLNQAKKAYQNRDKRSILNPKLRG